MVSDNGNRESDLAAALNKAGLVFYATWSAFGSFEKGRLFGLPELTTGVGLHSAKNFESNEHFKMNIGHLAPRNNQLPLPDMKTAQERKHYGAGIRSITYVLTTHPLRKWIDEIPNLDKVSTTSSEPPMLGKTASKVGLASKPKAWLCEKLGLNTGDRLTEFSIAKAIEDWSQKQCHNLFNDMETEYPKATERSVLKKALQNKFPGQF
ncbi:hypothetical protein [Aeromonas sp. Y293-4]|nr:hypothetical protein [Aeromonas sp. Y293-4]